MAQQQQQQKAAAGGAPATNSNLGAAAMNKPKPAMPSSSAVPRPMAPPPARPPAPASGVRPLQLPKAVGAPHLNQPRPTGAPSVPQVNLAAAAAAKKRKLAETPSDTLALSIPECESFNELLEAQMSIDAEIRRYHSEIQQAHQLSMSRNQGPCDPFKALLRLYVHSTHANQPHAKAASLGQNGQPREPPSWVLYVSARVVDPALEEAQAAAIVQAAKSDGDPDAPLLQPPSSLMPKNIQPGTSYLSRVEVRLDPEQYPGEEGSIVWNRSRHVGPFKDQLEIRRVGDRPCHATLIVDVDHYPPKYKVNSRLASLIEVECDTKAKVLRSLVAYLAKRQRRQVGSFFKELEKVIPLPEELRDILVGPNGNGTINVEDLGALLDPLLSKADPLVIHHEIKVDGMKHHAAECYDVEIDLPFPNLNDAATSNAASTSSSVVKLGNAKADELNQAYEKELEAHDQKLALTIKKINELRRRRTLLMGFADHPVELINSFVATQAGREIRAGRSNTGSDFEVERRSNFFSQPWAMEATSSLLYKKMHQQQHD